MRHAKSDWDADYGVDHDRPLNSRGVRSARLMGRLLAARDLVPPVIISSTAVRARTTAELAVSEGGWESELILEPRLYGSGVDGTIGVLEDAPRVDRLMIVGHQPTWSMLVSTLTGEMADMKTATVARIDRTSDSLVEVINPRAFFGSEHDPEARQ